MSTPMPPRVRSTRELLVDDLKRLLTVETTLAKTVLPKLVYGSRSTPVRRSRPSTTRSRSTRAQCFAAEALDEPEVAQLLGTNLEQEFAALKKLERIAQRLARTGAEVSAGAAA